MELLKQFKARSFLETTMSVFLILLSFATVVVFHTGRDISNHKKIKSNSKCHQSEEGDALRSAEDITFSPQINSIFFHETSCRGGLRIRQACVVESAARAHTDKQIYVLFSSPVNKTMLKNSSLAALTVYSNINLARVHLEKYAKNTPLEDMVNRKEFYGSKFWVEHTSDVLRSLTLYKWGGVYLDMDMLVVKSLAPLGNDWISKEIPVLVNSAAIAVSKSLIGRKLIDAILKELKTTYRSDLWAHNGPGAITRALHKLCSTHHMAEWSPTTCGGLDVYGPEYFFPVHYSNHKLYFEPGELNDVERNAYAYHLWNKLSHNLTAEKGSPFMKMAEQFCPTTFQMYGDKFSD